MYHAGTIDVSWKTIKYADKQLLPGDTLYIREGTYLESIGNFLTRSGTAQNRITYRNYPEDTVIIGSYASSVIARGISLTNVSYVTVHGFQLQNVRRAVQFAQANYCEIAHCKSTEPPISGQGWSFLKIYRDSSYNWLHHNEFAKNGKTDVGAILDIGDEYNDSER